MSLTTMSKCKMLLIERCVSAVLLSVAFQFVLLTVFLLFVNFQLSHPLSWVTGTLSLVCSFYTWFGSIPLLGAVLLYGVLLSQQYLAEHRYCPTRFRWLLHKGPRKLLFFCAHLLVGYLTAWLYTGYLNSDYRHLVYKCFGQDCLSSYHVFLLGMGIFAGSYYFISVHMRHEVSIDFDIIDLSREEKLRESLYETLLKAPVSSLMTTLSYTIVFWLCGYLLKNRLSHLLGVDEDNRLVDIVDVVGNLRLLFYAWLLTAQILSNMRLMQRFYAVLLSEDPQLAVARSRITPDEQDVTVVAALALPNAYIVQSLAAHFLYTRVQLKESPTRLQFFELTQPGNRAVNWRALCDQFLNMLDNFTDELTDSMQQISEEKLAAAQNDTNVTLLAEKLLLRQYNQAHGIRPVTEQHLKNSGSIRHIPNWCERTCMQLEALLHRLVHCIPCVDYLFAEPEDAKTLHLLENVLPLVWLTQALAHICVASITEDRFGVVQEDLPAIIKALHRLKCELEKLNNLRSKNGNYLLCTVQRCLYMVCISFSDYLPELITSREELRQLQSFLYLD